MGKGPAQMPRGRADARRNRDLILEAAAELLGRDPDVSLTEIADAAGIGRATVYRHFSDVAAVQHALEDEAVDLGRSLLELYLQEAGAGGSDWSPDPDHTTDLLRQGLTLRHRWAVAAAGQPLQDDRLISTFLPVTRALLRRAQLGGAVREDIDLDIVGECLLALALRAARRVYAGQWTADEATLLLRPLIDGLRPAPGAIR